jgi:hypothetical protein
MEEQRRELPAEQEEVSQAIRIRDGIAEALRSGRVIDHETAWLIARAITPGSGSLHQLALSGEIGPDIDADLAVAAEVMPGRAATWIAALEGYCFRRTDKGPIAGWLSDEASRDFTDDNERNDEQ